MAAAVVVAMVVAGERHHSVLGRGGRRVADGREFLLFLAVVEKKAHHGR